MFKHSQLKGLYVCNCCQEAKRDPILFHIPDETISVLVPICKECIEDLHGLFEEEPMFKLLERPTEQDIFNRLYTNTNEWQP